MNKTIAKEDIALLPVSAFEGKINVPLTADEIQAAVDYLRQYPVLGFDTETRPNFRKGQHNTVALLQLSAGDEAFLFRLNKIKLPEVVKQLLSDESIIKVGAAIHDDIKALVKLSPFVPAGFVDVQSLAKEVGIEQFGLRPLAALLMGIRISKAQQTSNWEISYLTEAQRLYAATDAWISLEIYTRLLAMKQRGERAE
ncbi:MAG: 3'-5' exonuclease domain-containing protein 2 [Salinivirgaceae bacterium]|nr:3'-5' exonuclease domain-containing protein 2 [Salinivirgaceae bacterium]